MTICLSVCAAAFSYRLYKKVTEHHNAISLRSNGGHSDSLRNESLGENSNSRNDSIRETVSNNSDSKGHNVGSQNDFLVSDSSVYDMGLDLEKVEWQSPQNRTASSSQMTDDVAKQTAGHPCCSAER